MYNHTVYHISPFVHTAFETYHSSSFIIHVLGPDPLDDREQLQVLKDDAMRRVDNGHKRQPIVKKCRPAMEARWAEDTVCYC